MLGDLFFNIYGLVFAICLGVSMLFLGIAGILMAFAHGDSRKTGGAYGCAFGAVACLAFGVGGLFLPQLFLDTVIKPLGISVPMETNNRNCDDTLQYQLVFNSGASSDERVNAVIQTIQTRYPNCSSDEWAPVTVAVNRCNTNVEGYEVPTSLHSVGEGRGTRRDSAGNIMVHFSTAPNDGSNCWLYDARAAVWLTGRERTR